MDKVDRAEEKCRQQSRRGYFVAELQASHFFDYSWVMGLCGATTFIFLPMYAHFTRSEVSKQSELAGTLDKTLAYAKVLTTAGEIFFLGASRSLRQAIRGERVDIAGIDAEQVRKLAADVVKSLGYGKLTTPSSTKTVGYIRSLGNPVNHSNIGRTLRHLEKYGYEPMIDVAYYHGPVSMRAVNEAGLRVENCQFICWR